MDSKDFAFAVRLKASSDIPNPNVERAIKIFEKLAYQEKWHVNDCVMLAGEIAAANGGVTQTQDKNKSLPLFADSLSSLELVEAIQPWVENVRVHIFGSAKAPFKSYREAVEWIEGEFSTRQDLEKQNRGRLRQITAEIENKIAELPRSYSREFFLTPQTFFIPYEKSWHLQHHSELDRKTAVFAR
jgi:hypothetical protein